MRMNEIALRVRTRPRATPLALAAILTWSSLATLSVRLAAVPPLLVTGLALGLGSLLGLPRVRQWRVPLSTLALGCAGLFGYHACLLLALRYAPAVEANLLNYLWPLLLVLLAPVLLPGRGFSLERRHVVAALLGFAGCALIVAGGSVPSPRHALGYALAVVAALLWASYSLLTKRVAPFPTAAVSGFGAASGLLALGAHGLLEPPCSPTPGEWLAIGALGLGPMGGAFLLWDAALKAGDPRSIGALSYLTPLLSTALLAAVGGGHGGLGARAAGALALILAGAWLARERAD